jgi:hypothetical protein
MSKKWRLTDRTRTLLTLELAIVLPAAALMGFSIWNLKHIQRDKAIEAAITRDFSSVLKIAEKETLKKANELLAPVRKEFPGPDDGDANIKAKLERLLIEHPEYAYAALYDKKDNLLVTRSQPGHDMDETFCAMTQNAIKTIAGWLPLESPNMAAKIRMMAEKEEVPVGFEGWWSTRENQQKYWNFAYFIPPGVAKDRVSLGMVAFDEDYLRKNFFPAMMKDVLNSKRSVLRADANSPVMMIHPWKDATTWVASTNWDGGKPEMERTFTDVFPELSVAIKYQGTTVADIGMRFLRYNYTVLV